MITREDIQSIIGPQWGPSIIADILAKIRDNDTSAVDDAAQLSGAHVVHTPRVRYVALVETTLVHTAQGAWHVAPVAAAAKVDPVGAIAMTELLKRPGSIFSGRALAASAGMSDAGARMLLIDLVWSGLIEPHHKVTGGECSCASEWLYGIENEASNAMQWTYTGAA